MDAHDDKGPRRLPPGAHGLPPELVARNQRERLIAAVAEACEERSYAEVSVNDIVKRAGISNATFYQQFADKRDCMLVAHEELFGRLRGEVEAACGKGGDRGVRAGVRLALELLAADPPSARLLAVEVLAAGPAGMARQGEAIETLASLLGCEQGESEGSAAGWARVAAMTMLVGRLVMAGEAARLPQLEDELVAIALDSGGSDG